MEWFFIVGSALAVIIFFATKAENKKTQEYWSKRKHSQQRLKQ